MKFLSYSVKAILFAMALTVVSCSGDEAKPAAAGSAAVASEQASAINIRYVDLDSISANYTLAKEIQQSEIEYANQLAALQRSKASEIERFGAQIQQKISTNAYLTAESQNSDIQKFNQMQVDAENQLAQLNQKGVSEMQVKIQELQDSIQSFIEEYNQEHGYDAILYRSAGLCFNPSLDVTKEVVDGLNARYVKK